MFESWLVGDLSKQQAASSLNIGTKQFQRRVEHLWDQPVEQISMPVSECLVVDGKRVGQQILLVASNTETINWLWSPTENSYYWKLLLSQLPEPRYLVCDGQKGLFKAISETYENVRVQRCLFHVWMNIRALLTLKPKGQVEQELLVLAKKLLREVVTPEDANLWIKETRDLGATLERVP